MVHRGFSTGIGPTVRDMSRQLQRLNNWGLVCLNGNHGTAGETRGSNASTRPLAVYGGAYLLHQRMVEGRDASAWCLRLVWSTHGGIHLPPLSCPPSHQPSGSTPACVVHALPSSPRLSSLLPPHDARLIKLHSLRAGLGVCMTCAREPATSIGCFQLG